MKAYIGSIGVVLAIAGCSEPVITASSGHKTQRPPMVYRGDNENVAVSFVKNPGESCRAVGLEAHHTDVVQACAVTRGSKTYLILPNPCRKNEKYARILCHELAHANGWAADHSRPTK